ncbi:MAG: hypothetical protein ACI8W7_002878 [Gammaproteobacteria bacterium]|jgi:hypothetical protein
MQAEKGEEVQLYYGLNTSAAMRAVDVLRGFARSRERVLFGSGINANVLRARSDDGYQW